MPTYQYRCRDCDEDLEIVQSFTDDALTTCPACKGSLRKVFAAPGISFKGSGFYKNDSRGSKSTTTNGATSESEKAPSGGNDTTSGSSTDSSSTSDTKSDSGSDSGSGSGSGTKAGTKSDKASTKPSGGSADKKASSAKSGATS